MKPVLSEQTPVDPLIRLYEVDFIGNDHSVDVLHKVRVLRMLPEQILTVIGKQVDAVAGLLKLMDTFPDVGPRDMHQLPVRQKPGDDFSVVREIFLILADNIGLRNGAEIHQFPQRACEHTRSGFDGFLFRKSVVHHHVFPSIVKQYIANIENQITYHFISSFPYTFFYFNIQRSFCKG